VRQLVERLDVALRGAVQGVHPGRGGRVVPSSTLDEAPAPRLTTKAAFARTLHAPVVGASTCQHAPAPRSASTTPVGDVASQRFLGYLARASPTCRSPWSSDSAACGGLRPLVELGAGPAGHLLAPQPLSRTAVEELVVRSGGRVAPEVVAAVHLAAGRATRS
jgi:hypothetical protein